MTISMVGGENWCPPVQERKRFGAHLYGWGRELVPTCMISFMRSLSVDILAFFMTDTLLPTHVRKTNLDRLDISSPV